MIKIINKIVNLNRFNKQILVYILDIFIYLFSIIISILIRFDFYKFNQFFNFESYILGLFLFTLFFLVFGLYRTIFRFSNLNIIRIIFLAILSYALLNFIINIYYFRIPISITVIQPIIFFLLVSIFRLFIPLLVNLINKKIKIPNAVIYGAGSNGSYLFNNLQLFNIKYFIDDDKDLIGKKISTKKIYTFDQINSYKKDKITHVFISFKIKNLEQKKQILEKFNEFDIVVRFVPEIENFTDTFFITDSLSEINFDDLLKKNKFYKVNYSSQNFLNSNVLVTGGGGSIGSELCVQLLELKVKKLVIVDNSEFNLYNINNTLNQIDKSVKVFPFLVSIQNQKELEVIFQKYDFDYVFHTAAYKHVPLIENNIISSVRNNIIGSKNVAMLSNKYNVSNLTLVSTDKAVKPTNIMGATKRISEKIFSSLANKQSEMNISIVRFGNVINSNGSVVPLFNKQIKNNGPVTVTHPDVTRYLMTIPDAVKLILEVSIISKEYKSGLTYLLDMGKPIKILDLAKKMINLYGLREGMNVNQGEIEIKFIGLRPGEKLYEELYLSDDIKNTKNDKIFLVDEDKNEFNSDLKITELEEFIKENNEKKIINFLINNVEGFSKFN